MEMGSYLFGYWQTICLMGEEKKRDKNERIYMELASTKDKCFSIRQYFMNASTRSFEVSCGSPSEFAPSPRSEYSMCCDHLRYYAAIRQTN
jgi:hypothetical protein